MLINDSQHVYPFRSLALQSLVPRKKIISSENIINLYPSGGTMALYFKNPNLQIKRILELLQPNMIKNKDFNCHGAASYVLFNEPLQYIEFPNRLGKEMTLEQACETFELPCGFQLWNYDKVIHSGVFLGRQRDDYYIFHKLGPENSEVAEINYGLYYYPNYTSLSFYGKKKLDNLKC